EAVNQPPIRRQNVSVRDHVHELTAITENADQKVMLAGLGADEQAEAICLQSPKSNPVAPGQSCPRGLTFVPMQDDGAVGRSWHGRLPATRSNGGARPRRPPHVPSCSAHFKGFCRFLPAIAHHFVLNDLPLIESAQSSTFDGGNVDEHILAAPLRLNESVALGRVEPLHGSRGHRCLLALSVTLRACESDRERITQRPDPSFGE